MKPKTFEEYDARAKARGKDFVLPIGKYKGKTVNHILREDPQYLLWLHKQAIFKIKKKIRRKAQAKVNAEREDYYRDLWEYSVFDIY